MQPYSARYIGLTGLLWCLLPALLPAADVLERHISVEFRQAPLKEALDEVARQGQFEWSYHAGIIKGAQPVSLSARNWTVRETLYALLGDQYDFRSNGNYLILKKRRRPPEALSGYVTDPATGRRLANATVYDRRTLRAATTDENGFYQLKKVDRRAEIVVAKLGYRDTILQISSASPRFQKIDLRTVEIPADTPRVSFFLQTTSRIERFFSATLDRWNAMNVPDSLHRRFQLSLLPSVGTNRGLSGKVANDVSINLLAGHSRAVHTVEVAGLGNFTREEVQGVQMAGLFNRLRGDNRGVQIAGIANAVADSLTGMQVGGVSNSAKYVAGFPLQVAGLVNTARNGQHFGQVAGLVNSTDSLAGFQIAGLVNRSAETRGVQIAGVYNRSRRMKGIQIGLVNSTNELQGAQIGLINRSGRRWMPVFNWPD